MGPRAELPPEIQLELDRLRRRAERERAARLEAERIAERSTRALYDHQRRIELIKAAAVAANDAAEPDHALQMGLDIVCEFAGWPVGHAYRVDPDRPDRLLPTLLWHVSGGRPYAIFREASAHAVFERGMGLPGRVLASARPAWILDVAADGNFPRGEAANAEGLRAAFAFPVLVGREVVAVLEFFSPETRAPDESFLAAMTAVGVQLGRVFERERGDAALFARERQLAEAQALVHVGSWAWDVESGRLEWSEELYRIFGLDPDGPAATFEGYVAALHPEDRDRVLSTVQETLQTGTAYGFVHRIVRADGVVRHVQSHGEAHRAYDGRIVRLTGTAQDVTEAQQVAAEREAYAARLEQSNRELQEFAYVASHDLQEPLRKIRAFADLLLAEYSGGLDPEGRAYLTRVQESAERMSRLIADLLALSRVVTRGKPPQPVDLNVVLPSVLLDLEVRLGETGGRVETDGVLPTVEADPVQMHQLLLNLVGNALKYRREGVPPVVRLCGHIEQGQALVSVSDNGIGFEEKYAERIFAPFQRLHARGSYEGTGMGLAIVRRIVERHGGSVSAQSEAGRGSTFTVRLPVRAR